MIVIEKGYQLIIGGLRYNSVVFLLCFISFIRPNQPVTLNGFINTELNKAVRNGHLVIRFRNDEAHFVTGRDIYFQTTSREIYRKLCTIINESMADDTNRIIPTGTAVEKNALITCTENLPQIDFLKIDVAGCKPEVLKGTTATHVKTKCLYITFLLRQLVRASSKPQEALAILNTYFDIFTETQGELAPFQYVENALVSLHSLYLSKNNHKYV